MAGLGEMDPAQVVALLRALRAHGTGDPNNVPTTQAGYNTQQHVANAVAQQGQAENVIAAHGQAGGQNDIQRPNTPGGGILDRIVESASNKLLQMLALSDAERRQRGLEEEVQSPEPGVSLRP